jgi:hypothetical protein
MAIWFFLTWNWMSIDSVFFFCGPVDPPTGHELCDAERHGACHGWRGPRWVVSSRQRGRQNVIRVRPDQGFQLWFPAWYFQWVFRQHSTTMGWFSWQNHPTRWNIFQHAMFHYHPIKMVNLGRVYYCFNHIDWCRLSKPSQIDNINWCRLLTTFIVTLW